MKKILYKLMLVLFIVGVTHSCKNGEWDFPDFEYSAVYFAYQSPIRTIVLGEDIFDTSLDNEYKCQIMATIGGVYSNKEDVTIDVKVDNSLCDNLIFDDNDDDILPMPTNYYSLLDDRITIKKGEILGGVTVQLTDDFFNDPLALSRNYVIPVVMTNLSGADSILSGTPLVDSPKRGVSDDWDILPKDYVLYAVKYINKYDANYLRSGKDEVSGGQTGTINRSFKYVEQSEVVDKISSRSLNTIAWEHRAEDAEKNFRNSVLLLTFDDKGECTIESETVGVTASGTGKFVSKGEKNSWGNKDRDALYLNYTIDYGDIKIATTDTLIVRDRGVAREVFVSTLKN